MGECSRDILRIENATEGNLRGVTLDIPRGRLVAFTGVSGSGKSTLAVDVLFNECQRQYLEALGMEGIPKPAVDAVRNASPALLISQGDANRNPRSTVGTVTDIYTDLRMVYEKLAVRACPQCGGPISAVDCVETTEKVGDEFTVYMDCHLCGHRMRKLTRTHFSYNTREGACPECQGLGRMLALDERALVHEDRSPSSGGIDAWEGQYLDYMARSFHAALAHYGIPVDEAAPISSYTPLQRAVLLRGVACDELAEAFPGSKPPRTVIGGRYEGAVTALWRRLSDRSGDVGDMSAYFRETACPACGGERLDALSRSATVSGARLPELSALSLDGLGAWCAALDASLCDEARAHVDFYLRDIATKVRRLGRVGLGYLSLDRQTITLSGGELQRVRLAATLDSELTGVLYIMDEPTIGLHPQDTRGMIALLHALRDRGNTVLVIEHDPDVMREADFLVDIGPGAGRHGGEIVAAGTLDRVLAHPASATARALSMPEPTHRPRVGDGGRMRVRGARRFNLRGIDVDMPTGCLTVVTGVSGSGKSTLVFDIIAAPACDPAEGTVEGRDAFDRIVTIEQASIARMRRSNVATYSQVYSEIRKLYGALPEARQRGLSARSFSFNATGGRCAYCEGLGTVESNLLFFQNIRVPCPTCGGRRFGDDVLSVRWQGLTIADVLGLSVEEALDAFAARPRIASILRLLGDVGLAYLELGQTLTTLSGGEAQRLKLARELLSGGDRRTLYLMDEPTTGLHPLDVANYIALVDRLIDAGHTVVVVEHNQQVLRAADWVVDLGPGGGDEGGRIVFEGTPDDMIARGEGATARCLRASIDQTHRA